MSVISPKQYVQLFKNRFLEEGNPEIAEGQMQYMRNQFEFYGLKAPQWMAIFKAEFKRNGLLLGEDLKDFATLCFDEDQREMHYIGLQMCEKAIKKQEEDFIYFLEELITKNSWWDTVDWINKLVGIHFKRFPDLIQPITTKWMDTDNFWLQRVCMIFQLTYKEHTDFELLTQYILRLAHSKEFFIQKAAGWSLRQYSKTAPQKVIAFVQANQHLAPLTKREAFKWLKKQGILNE